MNPFELKDMNALAVVKEELRDHLLMCDMPINQINPALELLEKAHELGMSEMRMLAYKNGLNDGWKQLQAQLRELLNVPVNEVS